MQADDYATVESRPKHSEWTILILYGSSEDPFPNWNISDNPYSFF